MTLRELDAQRLHQGLSETIHVNTLTNARELKNMSISKKGSLVSLESLDPKSEKVEGLSKAKNFINDIAFGTSFLNI